MVSPTIFETFKYYLKLSVYVLFVFIPLIFILPIMLISPYDYRRNQRILSYMNSAVAYVLGASFKIRGLENIQKNKGGVVVMNHQSALDVIFALQLLPMIDRAIPVSALGLLCVYPPIYFCFILLGGVALNLRNKESAKISINKTVDAIKNQNGKLVVFPEGTRNQGTFVQFKKGPFHVAIASQSCIQPVVISKYQFFDSKKKIFGRGTTIVKILPEISTKGMTRANVDGLLEKTRNLMQIEYNILNGDVMGLK